MSERGFVLLSRDVRDKPLFQVKPFCNFGAWIDLVMMTNWEDKHWKGELIERGTFVTSQPKLAKRWGWSRSKVQRFLDVLETEQRIEQLADSRRTKIRTTNYEQYQDIKRILNKKPDKKPNRDPNNDPGTTKEVQNNKEISTVPDIYFSELIPPKLQTEAFLIHWRRWADGRKAKRSPLTKSIAEANLQLAVDYGLETAIKVLSQSANNGWTGLFWDRYSKPQAATLETKRPEHRVFKRERPSPTTTQAQQIINQVTQKLSLTK